MNYSRFAKIPVRILLFVLLSSSKLYAQQTIGMADELKSLYDISLLPAYRINTISAQVSTYDTTGGNNDGFNGDYSFIRKTASGQLVIFDEAGPGVINRIWTPTPSADTLDFYIDDTTKPALTISYKDLFSGKVFPFVHPLCGSQLGGNYCYLPLLFQTRCMIVLRAEKTQFHQIQYRLFSTGTKVKSFANALDATEKEALKKIDALWGKENKTAADFVPAASSLLTAKNSFSLMPGETKTIFTSSKGGRITGIELSPSASFEGLDKDVDIRIWWDNEKIPAVYCPVADFFGYAFGKASMRSLLLGSKNNLNYCFFPMPFDKQAKIELINRHAQGSTALQLNATIYYSTQRRQVDKEGKLYTNWNSSEDVNGQPHVLLNATGKGHFAATLLQAQGLKPGMTLFFEGDDSTVIDGRLQLHGTGSEDYFNGGWYAFMDCWDTKLSLPLHGALDYSLPFCRTGGYRLYLSDKLSFEKSIYHSIEHGPVGNNIPSAYTSLSFYYADQPPATFIEPTNKLARVYVPDTLVLYPQLLEYTIWNNVDTKPLWAYPTGGESYSFTVTNESRLRISLKDILPGKYSLYADYETNDKGCIFSAWQRQTQLSDSINTWSPEKRRIENAHLCELSIDDLQNTLTVRFETTDGRNNFFLNRLLLVKRKE